MDTKDLKARKQKFESDLAAFTSNLIDEFKRDTGLTPTDIDIRIVEHSFMGIPTEYILEGVFAKLDF